ncbi:MAG: hypothetical protein ABI741_09655 [Ferruginibacter sp.]
MNTLLQNKFIRLIIPVCAILIFLSCQKDISNEDGLNPGQVADLTTKVNSSVSGFVTDENNLAVLGANVSVGGTNVTTDKFGYFQVKNVMVVKNAAMVTVTNPGYFKGIKTYIATENKAAFFRIKLIPKTNSGTINAASGGSVTLSNGLIVALPANAVITVGSGTAYTGTVSVAAHWLDPVASDLNETMPGDLRGIGTDGTLKTLTTYGMAAVELTGASGELLQIAAGKKATLTLTIPASIMASAPSTIPLWSFDETNGLWKQDGEATKTGNTYVGEVSHFSFWNCDVPANYVQFNCTIKDQAGNPIPYSWVRISVVGTSSAAYGFTDSSGYVAGAVPGNAQLLMEVFTYYNCGVPVYSQNFSTTNVNISLGTILVPNTSSIATISGTVTDCSNNPVTNGRIIVQQNGGYYYNIYPVSNTGAFSFTILLCNGNGAVTIVAEDMAAGQQSNSVPVTLVAGANVLGNLQACGITTQEFINFSIDGGTTTTSLTPPADSVYHSGNGSTTQSMIYGYSPGNPNSEISFSFNNTAIGVGTTQTLLSFYSIGTGQGTTTGTVTITEYGAVGQFISGNFTGVLVNTIPASYNISGSFRVRRNF